MTATVMLLVPEPAEPAEAVAAGVSYGIAGVMLGTAAITAGTIGVTGAIAIGAAGKAIVPTAKGILQDLRKYKISEKSDNRLVLKHK